MRNKGISRIVFTSSILLIITILVTCEKPERVVEFTTLEAQASDISYTTATLKGEITDAGSKPIEDHGILVSTDPNPRVGNATVKSLGSRTTKGIFSANVTELTKNTTYYFRSYVTIEGVDTYAEKICSFLTKDTESPTVTAGTIAALTMTSASLSGEVTSDGGESATIRGLCWGSTANPTISDCIDTTINGSGTGTFTGFITELTPGTQYYTRTYATNSKGTLYNSADIVFTTHDLPEVTTENVTDITKTTAASGGNVIDDGGVDVIARGVCWDTSTAPTIDLETRTDNGTGTGAFTSEITGLTEGTQYYLRAYATNQYGTSYGPEKIFTTLTTAPGVVTGSATLVTTTSATLNGTVNANGNSTTVTFEYGVTTSYGLEATADQSPVTGTTITAVSADITGLSEATTYHYRVKAVSLGGTTYGEDMTFTTNSSSLTVTDFDGNVYNTVQIGTQIWMTENLKTTHYADGSQLVDGTGAGDITNDYTTKYQFVHSDIESNAVTYGRLYTWAAVMNGASSSASNPSGVQGVCPTGWHVPSISEWTELIDYLGGSSIAGGPLKEAGNSHWLYSNVGATNTSGFTGLPHGYRNNNGNFYGMGTYGAYTTSTSENSYSHRAIMLRTENAEAYSGNYNRDDADAVRCVKD